MPLNIAVHFLALVTKFWCCPEGQGLVSVPGAKFSKQRVQWCRSSDLISISEVLNAEYRCGSKKVGSVIHRPGSIGSPSTLPLDLCSALCASVCFTAVHEWRDTTVNECGTCILVPASHFLPSPMPSLHFSLSLYIPLTLAFPPSLPPPCCPELLMLNSQPVTSEG